MTRGTLWECSVSKLSLRASEAVILPPDQAPSWLGLEALSVTMLVGSCLSSIPAYSVSCSSLMN